MRLCFLWIASRSVSSSKNNFTAQFVTEQRSSSFYISLLHAIRYLNQPLRAPPGQRMKKTSDQDASTIPIASCPLFWNVTCSHPYFIHRRFADIMAWCRFCYRGCWTCSCSTVWDIGGRQGDDGKKRGIGCLAIHRSVFNQTARKLDSYSRGVWAVARSYCLLTITSPTHVSNLLISWILLSIGVAGASAAITSDAVMTPFDGNTPYFTDVVLYSYILQL